MLQQNKNPIYIVHCFFINDKETTQDKRVVRDRQWFFFYKFETAEKCVLENWTDIYEIGYYNYAAIYPKREGSFDNLCNNETVWYKAEFVEDKDDPVVKKLGKIDPINDGIKGARLCFGD
jgi:hypothetical protein